jgi:predicted RNase H-like nuclease (RuvC/YqgF family)
MLEAARKSASQETAALRAEAEELREKVKAYDENNAILRHHVTAKRREVGALQQQLVEQTQVRRITHKLNVHIIMCTILMCT